MRRGTRIAAGLAVAWLAGGLALASCGRDQEQDEARIGLIEPAVADPFTGAIGEGVRREAARSGVALVTNTGGPGGGQAAVLEGMVADGIKGILIVPVGPRTLLPAIKKARERGVTVVVLGQPIPGPDGPDAWFSTDDFKAGELAGAYVRAKPPGHRTVTILDTALPEDDRSGVQRHNGFLNGLGLAKAGPDAVVPAGAPAVACAAAPARGVEGGRAAMAACLRKAPKTTLVFAGDEQLASGARTVLSAKGLGGKVTIVTVDGGCTGVRGVLSGDFTATVQRYPLHSGAQALTALLTSLRGGPRPTGRTDTGSTLITNHPAKGVTSKDTLYGTDNCWG